MTPPDSITKAKDIFTWDMIKMALNAAEEGFYIWDIEHQEIHYTEHCLKMMGYTRQEKAPNIFTESDLVIHEEDRAFFQNELRRYLEGHAIVPLRLEVRILNHHSKGWMWIRINGRAKYDNKRTPTSLVGVFVDITRRKHAEQRASEERELYRSVFDHIPNSIYVKNRESRFIMANAATANKMGIEIPSDLIGQSDEAFFTETSVKENRLKEQEIMDSGVPMIDVEYQEQWKKGDQVTWGKISKFPLYDSNGIVKGLIGISSDITSLKKVQFSLQAKIDELEKEQNLSRDIQLALLPNGLPRLSYQVSQVNREVVFGHYYIPCNSVSGDLFLVFPVGENAVGAMICDVMGHGVPAALVASFLRGLIEKHMELSNQPEAFVTRINKDFEKTLSMSNLAMLATAIYAYIDLEAKTCDLVNAGHPAPLLCRANGDIDILQSPKQKRTNCGLGLTSKSIYQSQRCELQHGDQLLFYTDGLTEARNVDDSSSGEFGLNRLVDHLKAEQPQKPDELVKKAFRGAAQFSSTTDQEDDICLLAFQYTETPLA